MGAELTGGQQRFALEYAKDGNGAAAARRAGYSAKGAKQQASHLLTVPNVQAAVSAAVGQHFADLNLDLARIIRERPDRKAHRRRRDGAAVQDVLVGSVGVPSAERSRLAGASAILIGG